MIRELRFAFRMLAKSPAFTIIAVLAVALGIGGSTTMFSAVNALLLRPMPLIQNQDRLIYINEYFSKSPDQDTGVAFPDYLDWKKQASTLELVAAAEERTIIVSGKDRPDRYLGAAISADTFESLGVQPLLGRLFRADEDDLNAAPVALLGYDVWQKNFGGDPSVVGKIAPVNGKPTTIVGVMPKGWRFPEVSDIWVPLQLDEKDHPRGNHFLDVIGKMKPGVSVAHARAELEAITARLAADYPESNAGSGVHVRPLREEMVKNFETLTFLVMGAVLFVHLIACANVANLLLARGATRSREVAIRLAVGATRPQIVRQLLAESLLLGLGGSALGLIFAVWGVDLMVAAIPNELPYWLHFDIDGRVFAFALATGLISSVIFGLVPALTASRPRLTDVLKEGGGRGAGGTKGQRVRNGLVVAEVALALILLVGAGLMMRSFQALQRVDIGADVSSMLTFRIGLPESQFTDPETPRTFFDELLPKLAVLPGVESVAATTSLPAAGSIGLDALVLEGEPEPKQLQDARMTRQLTVTPGFLQTAHIRLLEGRDFSAADHKDVPRVALIDEVAARQWFPDRDPIGRKFRIISNPGQEPEWATVIGVVRPVIYDRIVRKRIYPVVYFTHAQVPERFMSIAMRTRSNPLSFVNAARAAVAATNKDVPIYRVYTGERVAAESVWDRKFFSSLFTTFAGLALFLASLGLYGVMDYSVRQRTQEIGVRVALGAQAAAALRMIATNGMRLIGLGLVIGFVGAFFLMQLLASSLHGVSAHDPVSFTVVPLILLIVGLIACYVPARQAMRLDPTEALRYE